MKINFPDPLITNPFPAPNGVEYTYNFTKLVWTGELASSGGGGSSLAPYVSGGSTGIIPSSTKTIQIAGGNFDDSTSVSASNGVTINSVTAINDNTLSVSVTTPASFGSSVLSVDNGGTVSYGDIITINELVASGAFEFQILTPSADYSYSLHLRSGFNYNFVVDWGDGSSDTITSYNQAEIAHIYPSEGFYEVVITGLVEAWYKNNSHNIMTKVHNLGRVGWLSLENAFNYETNLTSFNSGDCDTSLVTSLKKFMSVTSANKLVDVSTMDVSNVTDFNSCFSSTSIVELDLRSWNTSSALDMIGMFNSCFCSTMHVGNLDLSSVTSISSMFYNCNKAIELDVASWDVGLVLSFQSAFHSCTSLRSLDVSLWDVSSGTDMESMFDTCKLIETLDLSSWNVINVSLMREMFSSCERLTFVDFGASFNSSNVVDMSYMFELCESMTTLDVSVLDTSLCSIFSGMFMDMPALTTLNVTGLVGGSGTNLTSMFRDCTSLAIADLSSWDVTGVTTLASFFSDASSIASIDFTGWSTTSLVTMDSMFTRVTSGLSLDLSMFDVSQVTGMNYMFQYATGAITVDTTGWVTSSLISLRNFADSATLLDIDISHFDIKTVSNFTYLMKDTSFSQTNYDKLLPLWAAQSPVSVSEAVHFGTAKYSPSNQVHRDTLDFAPNNWTITDGGVGDEEVPVDITDPTEIAGLTIWLDASDRGVVADQWDDKSGQGNHFTTRAASVFPVFANDEAEFPVGAMTALDGPDLSSYTEGEIFAVFKTDRNLSNGIGDARGLWAFTGTAQNEEVDHYTYQSNIYSGFGSTVRKSFAPAFALDEYSVTNIYSSAGDWKYLVDGVEKIADVTNTVNFNGSAILGLCDQARSLSNNFEGKFMSLVMFDRKLTDGERQKMLDYMSSLFQPIMGGLLPASYFRLGDSGAVAVDEIGGADGAYSGGVVVGQPSLVPSGADDTSVELDGLTSNIDLPNSAIYAVGTGDFSWSMFIKSPVGIGERFIIDARGSYANQIINLADGANEGKLRYAGSTTVYGTSRVDDGLTHLLSIVRESGTVTLYVDGVAEASGLDSTDHATATGTVFIGKNLYNGGTHRINAFLDELAFFDRALTQAEITKTYDDSELAL